MREKIKNKKLVKVGLTFWLVFILIAYANPMIFHFHAGEPGPSHQQPDLLLYLQPGDIITMDLKSDVSLNEWIYRTMDFPKQGINSNDHVVLFVGTRIGYTGNDWCIHNGDKTKYTRLYSDTAEGPALEANHCNFSIYRVITANSVDITQVIEWAQERIAKNCSFQNYAHKEWDNVTVNTILGNSKFYCTELVWAAYFNVTWWTHQKNPLHPIIDIDYNNNSDYPYGGIQQLQYPVISTGIKAIAFVSWMIYWIVKFGVHWTQAFEYAKLNEIKIDDDIEQIYPPLP